MGIRSGQIVGNNEKDPRILSAGGATSPLLSGLVHYWTLDEASGTRADSVGSVTFTDNNTVGSAAGKNSNAATFVTASSEYLSSTSTAMRFTAGITRSLWFRSTTVGVFRMIATKDDVAGNREWALYITGGNALTFWLDAGAQSITVASVADSNWHFVVMWRDSDGTAHAQMDGGTVGNGSATSPVLGTAEFRLGGRADGSFYFQGDIDEFGEWSRVLTADERATLYNSGTGKFYPSF